VISLDRRAPEYPLANQYIRAVAGVVFEAFHSKRLIEVEGGRPRRAAVEIPGLPYSGAVTWHFTGNKVQLLWCIAVDRFLFNGSLPGWLTEDEDFELFKELTRSMARAIGLEDHSDDARLQAADEPAR
jgi:hypothetical protein